MHDADQASQPEQKAAASSTAATPDAINFDILALAANALVEAVHHQWAVPAGWWTDLETGERKQRNQGELMMLIVSEIAEAMEGARKNLMDDHITHRKMVEVEMADAVIRIADFCGGFGLDLGGAIADKLRYNVNRADHKIENRKLENGKKF